MTVYTIKSEIYFTQNINLKKIHSIRHLEKYIYVCISMGEKHEKANSMIGLFYIYIDL